MNINYNFENETKLPTIPLTFCFMNESISFKPSNSNVSEALSNIIDGYHIREAFSFNIFQITFSNFSFFKSLIHAK